MLTGFYMKNRLCWWFFRLRIEKKEQCWKNKVARVEKVNEILINCVCKSLCRNDLESQSKIKVWKSVNTRRKKGWKIKRESVWKKECISASLTFPKLSCQVDKWLKERRRLSLHSQVCFRLPRDVNLLHRKQFLFLGEFFPFWQQSRRKLSIF